MSNLRPLLSSQRSFPTTFHSTMTLSQKQSSFTIVYTSLPSEGLAGAQIFCRKVYVSVIDDWSRKKQLKNNGKEENPP